MTAIDPAPPPPVEAAAPPRLHARLAAAADRDDLLDVAYRTVDSPVGSLLIVATAVGPRGVAFGHDGPDAGLQNLADRISSRLLHAPKRLDAVARQLDEYFSGRRRTFEVPLDWQPSPRFFPGGPR